MVGDRIEIWPGVISAIRCHEEQLLMCCEMSHKILRTDTVLDFMYDLYRRCRDRFQEVCTQTLVGTSALTRSLPPSLPLFALSSSLCHSPLS